MRIKRTHVLLTCLIILVGYFLYLQTRSRDFHRELSLDKIKVLETRYGEKLYSEHNEELIIREFFQDRRNGFFVDVGANHHELLSNTYYLERKLGWQGIAVDALSKFAEGYQKYRKNTRFFSFFISDKSDEEAVFYVNTLNDLVSSGNVDFAKQRGEYKQTKVHTITLDDLLEFAQVKQIDFLSMDIELGEPAALAGFEIRRYKPQLVCIESYDEIMKEILDYFKKNDYEVIEKYKELDIWNLYFTPKRVD